MSRTAPKPCTIDGVAYSSRHAAARALGVDRSTIRRAIARGGVLAAPPSAGRPPRPCRMNGEQWPSLGAAARGCGVSVSAIHMALDEGREWVGRPPAYRSIAYSIDGMTWPSMRALADDMGVTPQFISQLRRKGRLRAYVRAKLAERKEAADDCLAIGRRIKSETGRPGERRALPARK